MKYVRIPLLLLCLAFAATGCLKEDTDNCYNIIRFSYKGDGTEEIFAEKIQKVDLYVFDENYNLVMQPYTLSEQELAEQSATVRLVPGNTYRVVAVGNAHNSAPYGVVGGNHSDGRMCHHISHPEIETEETVVDSQDHLYFGGRDEGCFTVPPEGNYVHSISMESSHIGMWVSVSGYAPPVRSGDGSVAIEHEACPVWFDVENRHSKHSHHVDNDTHESHTQRPKVAVLEDGTCLFEYNILRHVDDEEQWIKLYDANSSGGEPIFEVNMAAFLAENRDRIDPNLQEALIPIQIEVNNAEFEVRIADWAVEDTDPGF